ncbi:MAG: hypothetical protein Q9187_001514 [Circinaria calcarea]
MERSHRLPKPGPEEIATEQAEAIRRQRIRRRIMELEATLSYSLRHPCPFIIPYCQCVPNQRAVGGPLRHTVFGPEEWSDDDGDVVTVTDSDWPPTPEISSPRDDDSTFPGLPPGYSPPPFSPPSVSQPPVARSLIVRLPVVWRPVVPSPAVPSPTVPSPAVPSLVVRLSVVWPPVIRRPVVNPIYQEISDDDMIPNDHDNSVRNTNLNKSTLNMPISNNPILYDTTSTFHEHFTNMSNSKDQQNSNNDTDLNDRDNSYNETIADNQESFDEQENNSEKEEEKPNKGTNFNNNGESSDEDKTPKKGQKGSNEHIESSDETDNSDDDDSYDDNNDFKPKARKMRRIPRRKAGKMVPSAARAVPNTTALDSDNAPIHTDGRLPPRPNPYAFDPANYQGVVRSRDPIAARARLAEYRSNLLNASRSSDAAPRSDPIVSLSDPAASYFNSAAPRSDPATSYSDPAPAVSYFNPNPATSYFNPAASRSNPAPAASYFNPNPATSYFNPVASRSNPAPAASYFNPNPATSYFNPAASGSNPAPAASYFNPATSGSNPDTYPPAPAPRKPKNLAKIKTKTANEEPENKKKKQDNPWTEEDDTLLGRFMGEVVAEKKVNHSERKRCEEVARRLAEHDPSRPPRTWGSIKSRWNRSGREKTGIDERRNPNPEKMTTGIEHDRSKKRKLLKEANEAKRREMEQERPIKPESSDLDIGGLNMGSSSAPSYTQNTFRHQEAQGATPLARTTMAFEAPATSPTANNTRRSGFTSPLRRTPYESPWSPRPTNNTDALQVPPQRRQLSSATNTNDSPALPPPSRQKRPVSDDEYDEYGGMYPGLPRPPKRRRRED